MSRPHDWAAIYHPFDGGVISIQCKNCQAQAHDPTHTRSTPEYLWEAFCWAPFGAPENPPDPNDCDDPGWCEWWRREVMLRLVDEVHDW